VLPVAVIDTSVWVSAFLTPGGSPARLVAKGREGLYSIVGSLPLLQELAEVLTRPRIARLRQTSAQDVELFVAGVASVTRLVDIPGSLALCRDPEDDVLLETAMMGGATCIVSRDEDITRDPELRAELCQLGREPLTVRQFLALLGDSA